MIYLLRHGETIWNTLGRFQGQEDSPLTERGMEQADRVAGLLSREIADNVQSFEMHVSPLGRTRETATRVQRVLPLTSREDARLMEVSIGAWDGLTRFEIENEFPGMLDGSDAFDWYFRAPDGETFDAACARARSWISSLQKPTVAISHGLFGRLIRGVYSGLSKREMLELPVPQDGFYRLHDNEFSLMTGGRHASALGADLTMTALDRKRSWHLVCIAPPIAVMAEKDGKRRIQRPRGKSDANLDPAVNLSDARRTQTYAHNRPSPRDATCQANRKNATRRNARAYGPVLSLASQEASRRTG